MSNNKVNNPFEKEENLTTWFEKDKGYNTLKQNLEKQIIHNNNNNTMQQASRNKFLAPIIIGVGALAALTLVATSGVMSNLLGNQAGLTQVVAAEQERQDANQGKMLHQVSTVDINNNDNREYYQAIDAKYMEWAKDNDPYYEEYAETGDIDFIGEFDEAYQEITTTESYSYDNKFLNLAKNSDGDVIFADMQLGDKFYFYDSFYDEYASDIAIPTELFEMPAFYCEPDQGLIESTFKDMEDSFGYEGSGITEEQINKMDRASEIFDAIHNPATLISNQKLFNLLKDNADIVEEVGTINIDDKKLVEFKISDPFSEIESSKDTEYFNYGSPDTTLRFDAKDLSLYQVVNIATIDEKSYTLDTMTFEVNEFIDYDEDIFSTDNYGFDQQDIGINNMFNPGCFFNDEELPTEVYDVFASNFITKNKAMNDLYLPDAEEPNFEEMERILQNLSDNELEEYSNLKNQGVISQEVLDAAEEYINFETGMMGPLGPIDGPGFVEEISDEEKESILSDLGLQESYDNLTAQVSMSPVGLSIFYSDPEQEEGSNSQSLSIESFDTDIFGGPFGPVLPSIVQCDMFVEYNNPAVLSNGLTKLNPDGDNFYAYFSDDEISDPTEEELEKCGDRFEGEFKKVSITPLNSVTINGESVNIMISSYGSDDEAIDSIVEQIKLD